MNRSSASETRRRWAAFGVLAMNVSGWLLVLPAFFVVIAEAGQVDYVGVGKSFLTLRNALGELTRTVAWASLAGSTLAILSVRNLWLHALGLVVGSLAPFFGLLTIGAFGLARFFSA